METARRYRLPVDANVFSSPYFSSRSPTDPIKGTAQATATQAAGTTWRNAKWGGGGYVTGLIFHPTSANVLDARTDIGSAYRWNPATMSWIPITDGFGAAESFYQGAESIAWTRTKINSST